MINEILGDVPVIKVLDFLMKSVPHDFTKNEIEEKADVGYTELRRDFDSLIQNKMVVETRRIGGVPLYTLNDDNRIVNAVVDFCEAISIEAPILTKGGQLVTLVEEPMSEHEVVDTEPATLDDNFGACGECSEAEV